MKTDAYSTDPCMHLYRLSTGYLKKSNESLTFVSNKIEYPDIGWTICDELKVIYMLLGKRDTKQISHVSL